MDSDSDVLQLDIESNAVITDHGNNGRRRRGRNSSVISQSNGNAAQMQETSPFADILGSSPPPERRSRRQATWADEEADNLQYLRSIGADERTKNSGSKSFRQMEEEDENEVMPLIPDLEEVKEQEFVQQTADAPSVQVNKLNLEQLDKDLQKQAAFSTLDGIDLGALTKFCLPESQVKEADLTWHWDNLVSEITSKLMSDNDSIGSMSIH